MRRKREEGSGKRERARRLAVAGLLTVAALACSKPAEKPPADSAAPATASKSIPQAPASRASLTASRRTILFAGTSLTAGLGLDPDSAYPMLIQRKIDSAGLPFDVVNAGVSGETSSGLLDRLDWLLRGKFDVLVIESGANDGLRGIPTSTLQANLETDARSRAGQAARCPRRARANGSAAEPRSGVRVGVSHRVSGGRAREVGSAAAVSARTASPGAAS